ncbi:hypothetical protein TNCV_154611 [Trichonephila clavipes]|uniref:Uncharacterized protein n=1 Tax=Trichonephila clavipes TaxID=2585209 RepID=A0A8X6WH38_TRICX|nr:hypothetical protein TNCV_154611 [Trichonephila clavipes]
MTIEKASKCGSVLPVATKCQRATRMIALIPIMPTDQVVLFSHFALQKSCKLDIARFEELPLDLLPVASIDSDTDDEDYGNCDIVDGCEFPLFDSR